jgi:hypothetical protein
VSPTASIARRKTKNPAAKNAAAAAPRKNQFKSKCLRYEKVSKRTLETFSPPSVKSARARAKAER